MRELPDEATQLLADLVARRRQIIEMIVAERNREKRVAVMRIRKSIARLIAALEKELAEIDAEIDRRRARIARMAREGGPPGLSGILCFGP